MLRVILRTGLRHCLLLVVDVALTLPALIVGAVGGGTALSTQKEWLEMLKCSGAGNANKFAEICCAVALAGEISIVAAMAANHFSSTHQKLGRKQ